MGRVIDETNWARNIRYGADDLVAPTTVSDLQRVVAGAPTVKALGSRHSFSRVADTAGVLVSTHALAVPIEIDTDRRRVRTGSGVRYGELARHLDAHGWALGNLASLPHISVAGAVSTGTHGSGDANRSLAAAVAAIELVASDGELRRFERGDAEFPGAVVGLGALGVASAVELDIEPTYDVAQTLYEAVPFDAALDAFDEITGSGYSVSLFTTLRDPDAVDQVWRKVRTDRPAPPTPAVLQGREAPAARHPLPGVSAASCTEQGGVPGTWLDRLPHFRLEFTPSNGAELQSEYLLPRAHAAAALTQVRELAAAISPFLQVCEVRTVASDDLWLSPAYDRETVGIHFTWKPDEAGVASVLPAIEAAFAPFAARPHWGKVFSREGAAGVGALYPRWADFGALRARLDPRGAFANDYLDAIGL